MNKEIKKITAGLMFSWIFGILFLLTGIGIIGSGGYTSGIIIILCAMMLIPYFSKLVAEKWHIEISGGSKSYFSHYHLSCSRFCYG